MFTAILNYFKAMFKDMFSDVTIDDSLDSYIVSRNPTSVEEVEFYEREFYARKTGKLYF